ncbi:hypothetical protein K435DRAFT_322757 [Dendrothele bispora CBS 962.96]|uniref:Uncharacterized protein n=1 Tax=Dendrothele bispora (strain CBS 962.96) TaxID=1314807 RepID=A0A4S8MJX5_DENBC|nr:hypothetical protein K435DRAFT_322757 [Dendrothele bispora CBS 962.96]
MALLAQHCEEYIDSDEDEDEQRAVSAPAPDNDSTSTPTSMRRLTPTPGPEDDALSSHNIPGEDEDEDAPEPDAPEPDAPEPDAQDYGDNEDYPYGQAGSGDEMGVDNGDNGSDGVPMDQYPLDPDSDDISGSDSRRGDRFLGIASQCGRQGRSRQLSQTPLADDHAPVRRTGRKRLVPDEEEDENEPPRPVPKPRSSNRKKGRY